MPDYDPGPARPDLAEKVTSLREHGMSVIVVRMESQARPDGSVHEPVWGCDIRSSDVRISSGEGASEHEAFERAYALLPDLPQN